MFNYSFTFNPKKKGLRQILGDLETDIMEIVWNKDEITVRETFKQINSKKDIAYTTVMTVMSRLADKGLLLKVKDGAAFIYRPAVSRKEFTRTTVNKVMSSLLENFAAPSVNQFLDYIEDDPGKMEELAKLIEEKRKKNDE